MKLIKGVKTRALGTVPLEGVKINFDIVNRSIIKFRIPLEDIINNYLYTDTKTLIINNLENITGDSNIDFNDYINFYLEIDINYSIENIIIYNDTNYTNGTLSISYNNSRNLVFTGNFEKDTNTIVTLSEIQQKLDESRFSSNVSVNYTYDKPPYDSNLGSLTFYENKISTTSQNIHLIKNILENDIVLSDGTYSMHSFN